MKIYIVLGLLFLSFFQPVQAAKPGPQGYLIIPGVIYYETIYFIPIENRDYDLTDLYTVGHLDQTTWIHDTWGRVVLVGHNPGAFTPLLTVQPGDRIIVGDDQGAVEYEVIERRVVAVTETQWLAPTTQPTLLLMTCDGEKRVLVFAR